MKSTTAIALCNLSPALHAALTAQFELLGYIVSSAETVGAASICISHKAWDEEIGVPVLVIDSQQPWRLGSILRQSGRILADPLPYLKEMRVGDFMFRPREGDLLTEQGEAIALTDRETGILAYLAQRRGQTVLRQELLLRVWAYQDGIDTHTLETHVYRLRQKMGLAADDKDVLLTEAGGYRLL